MDILPPGHHRNNGQFRFYQDIYYEVRNCWLFLAIVVFVPVVERFGCSVGISQYPEDCIHQQGLPKCGQVKDKT